MLCVKEVAERLSVHPATVYRWIKEGYLPSVRYGKAQAPGGASIGPGGAIRVPESALVDFPVPTPTEAV